MDSSSFFGASQHFKVIDTFCWKFYSSSHKRHILWQQNQKFKRKRPNKNYSLKMYCRWVSNRFKPDSSTSWHWWLEHLIDEIHSEEAFEKTDPPNSVKQLKVIHPWPVSQNLAVDSELVELILLKSFHSEKGIPNWEQPKAFHDMWVELSLKILPRLFAHLPF